MQGGWRSWKGDGIGENCTLIYMQDFNESNKALCISSWLFPGQNLCVFVLGEIAKIVMLPSIEQKYLASNCKCVWRYVTKELESYTIGT